MTAVFLDTEFTSPCQHAQLISLALVSEDGAEFYAELTDYAKENVSGWVWENVMPHLSGLNPITRSQLAEQIRQFLTRFEHVEIWADCCSYDWVLFCELYSGPAGLPANQPERGNRGRCPCRLGTVCEGRLGGALTDRG